MSYKFSDYAEEFRRRSGPHWKTALDYARGKGPAPVRPYQVEIHPVLVGSPVCMQRCVDCHGQFHRERGQLTAANYDELIDDLIEMQVPSVVLSGAYSDPSCSESLLMSFLHRGGPHWGIKLHTYGLGLTPLVRHAIVEAAVADPTGQSYVTLSKSTTDHGVFQEMCRPIAAAPSLVEEERQLKDLFRLVERAGGPLEVRLNYRITKMNGRPHQLAALLCWLKDAPPFVKVRFTTDYVPSHSSPEYLAWFYQHVYVSPQEAQASIREAIDGAGQVDRTSFRGVEEATEYYGSACYNGLLFSTVSATGLVYPCQGVAFSHYEHLSYGDVAQRRFSDCWREYALTWHDADCQECPRCAAACERSINDAIDKELHGGSL